ncbi:MAG: hypothetical protein ABW170_23475 [Candidatus Thiodiazotropha sp. L084R]
MAVSQENELIKLVKLAAILRKRPGMYVFPVTLQSVRNFFSGYFSYSAFGEDDEYYNFFDCYKPPFGDWVANKEGGRNAPGTGWVECIMENAKSEDEAIDRFFRYFDEYIADVVNSDSVRTGTHTK